MEEKKAFEDLTEEELTKIWKATKLTTEYDSPIANFINRYVRSKCSKEFSSISPLHIDICQQPRCLPPNASLTISLTKQDVQNFNVLTKTTNNYQIKIVSLKLKVLYKKIDPDILQEIINLTQKGKRYRYPISRVELLQFTKSAGSTDLSENNIFKVNNVAPNRFFAVFVEQSAFTGSAKRDPFNYKNINIRSYRLIKSGNETVNSTVHCNRNDFDFHEPFHYLLNAVNLIPQAEENLGIDINNFEHRNFILGFKLNKTHASPLELSDLPEKTFYSLDIKLNEAHETPLSLIIYAEYDAEILIDAFGNVMRSDNGLAVGQST